MAFEKTTIIKTACMALTLSMATVTVITISATSAFAERGGNGNGRGNSGSRGNSEASQVERKTSGNNGRGHLARELRGLNAAHANANALANASPNSMPGKLNAYKLAQENFADVVAAQDDAYAEYQRLLNLTDDEVGSYYPEGGYEDAISFAAADYTEARENALQAQTTSNESLSILTDGRDLSVDALAELRDLLNL